MENPSSISGHDFDLKKRWTEMRLKSFLLTGSLFCLPFATHAQDASDALLRSLYVKSGMQYQIQQLPVSMQQGFDQGVAADQFAKNLNFKIISALRKSIGTVFVPETIKRTMLEELRGKLSSEDVRAVLIWLDSPLGTKITKLEKTASTPDAIKKLPRFIKKLRKEPPAQDRFRAIGRMDSAVKATETSVELAMVTQLATIVAIVSTVPEERRAQFPDLRAAVEKSRPQIEGLVKARVLVRFLYAYRSLSVSELDKYVKFAESDVGRRYHDAAIGGIKKALIDSLMKLPTAIADEFKARNI